MNTYLKTIFLGCLVFAATTALPSMAKEQVYGWQLMTEQEREEHRAKMQSFKTKEEREAYRVEHHKKMQQRAKEQGLSLPEHPQPQGEGMGMGNKSPGEGKGR